MNVELKFANLSAETKEIMMIIKWEFYRLSFNFVFFSVTEI